MTTTRRGIIPHFYIQIHHHRNLINPIPTTELAPYQLTVSQQGHYVELGRRIKRLLRLPCEIKGKWEEI